jgi:hypothetical protein
MKVNLKPIIVFTLGLIALCFLAVWLFTLPTFFQPFNLTNKSNIGSTIGGITAPVIGIFSAVFLYLALTRQTEANSQQKLKDESDVIFLLLDQLDREIGLFYTTVNKGKEEIRHTGIEGLNKFCFEYRFEWNTLHKDDNYTFKVFYEAGLILLVIESFLLVEKRIELATLNDDIKNLFKSKANIYYEYLLKIPLSHLSEAFEMYPNQKDETTRKIQDFVNRIS